MRGLTVVAKFLSPDREIVSRFRDCLPFGDMSLAENGLSCETIKRQPKISFHTHFKRRGLLPFNICNASSLDLIIVSSFHEDGLLD